MLGASRVGTPTRRALSPSHGIAAARLIVDGAGLGEVGSMLGVETLFGVIYIAIGFSMFRWFEYQAKKRGTLEVV